MTEASHLADQIRRAATGDAWHGPSLSEVVDDVMAAEAAAHPVPGAHSIWELVGHITTWTNAVRRRLAGEHAEPTDAENFPVPADVTPGAWTAACDAALDAHDALARAVDVLPEERLHMTVPGRAYSNYVMLHGAVQHTLYHTGQIAILKRALGTRASVSATGARYLALGDSYTIGEGVDAADAWPAQLARALRYRGLDVSAPHVIARTGWTCDELAAGIDAAAPEGPYALVSLLIGVNDQYRGNAPERYGESFERLLRRAIEFAGRRSRRVIVLSIPDWSVSPFAEGHDRSAIAASIDRFNDLSRAAAGAAGVRYVDITGRSRRFAAPEDFAADGLHPSRQVYTEWARLAEDAAVAALAT